MNEQTPITDTCKKLAPWCLMANGQNWHYHDCLLVTADELLAMAEMLGKIARFNGATDGAPYSVAQHSMLVADLVSPSMRPYALLHDFHEAVLGDLITPAKSTMLDTALSPTDQHVIRRAIGAPREAADIRIYSGAGLDLKRRATFDDVIKHADLMAMAVEVWHLFPHTRARTDLLDELESIGVIFPNTKLSDLQDGECRGIKMPRLKHPIRPLPWDKAADALKAEMRRILPVFNGGQMP